MYYQDEIEKLRVKKNRFKNSVKKDPIKELSFYMSPGLEYLGNNHFYLYENTKGKIKALVSIQFYKLFIYRNSQIYTERERERQTNVPILVIIIMITLYKFMLGLNSTLLIAIFTRINSQPMCEGRIHKAKYTCQTFQIASLIVCRGRF